MFAVDFCGCYTFDRTFFPSSWLAEVTLKHWYDAKVVAEMTYSKRPMFSFVPINRKDNPYRD